MNEYNIIVDDLRTLKEDEIVYIDFTNFKKTIYCSSTVENCLAKVHWSGNYINFKYLKRNPGDFCLSVSTNINNINKLIIYRKNVKQNNVDW
jgi:hypothetical protein